MHLDSKLNDPYFRNSGRNSQERGAMTEHQETQSRVDEGELLQLTAEIVAAHVGKTAVPNAELPELIASVHAALAGVGAPEPEAPPAPAVSVKKSVQDEHIICLECGKKMKMLKRHLNTDHGMTPAEYRARWNLPADYPMVAPAYSRKRQNLAKEIGLGRKPAEAPAAKGRRKTAG
jgi:predicted transcriptional regulator